MKKITFTLFIIFSIVKLNYSQSEVFASGELDELGEKVGFHIQYLDSRFISCDSNDAFYRHYVYFVDGKPLKNFSLPPKFIRRYNLESTLGNASGDSIMLLDGEFSFSHRRKADSMKFIYKDGYLVYEQFVSRRNKPTILIPTFEVFPNYEFYVEERYYTKTYKNYFPSFYFESSMIAESKTPKDKQMFYIYYDENKLKVLPVNETD